MNTRSSMHKGPSQLIQVRQTLFKNSIAIDESTIDPEYLEDFRAPESWEVEQYLQDPSHLFDSTYFTSTKPISVENEKIYKDMKLWSIRI